MKHSITLLFTFIILAFGAVFSAPVCKAVDYPFANNDTYWNETNFAQLVSDAKTNLALQDSALASQMHYGLLFLDGGSNYGTNYSILFLMANPADDLYINGSYNLTTYNDHQGYTNPFYHDVVFGSVVQYNSNTGAFTFGSWDSFSDYASIAFLRTYSVVLNYEPTTYLTHNINSFFYMFPDADPDTISDTSPTNFRALFQGAFDITYIDDDNGYSFPVQVYSSWYRKNGVETEILRLGIVDSNSVGWSYNGHFHFSPRVSNITAFRWLIGSVDYETIDDFELPTVNNSFYSLSYHLTLFSNDISSVQTGVPFAYTSTNKFNIDIGNGDVRYKGFKDSFIASQFDSEFTSPEFCSYFFFDSIDFYPYNTHVSTYILDGDIKGLGARTALENTKIDDETRSYHPVTFTGDTVPVDFPNFNLDNFDFTGINSLLGCFFDSWYVSVLLACISVGIVGYVLFGKS